MTGQLKASGDGRKEEQGLTEEQTEEQQVEEQWVEKHHTSERYYRKPLPKVSKTQTLVLIGRH
ncbi:MAG: hypothetical protein QXX18_09190 [Candidatus Jordarchaeales archaeon]